MAYRVRSHKRRTAVIVTVLILVVGAGVALGVWRLTQFTPTEVNLTTAVAGAQAGSGGDAGGRGNSGGDAGGRGNSGGDAGDSGNSGSNAGTDGSDSGDNTGGAGTRTEAGGSNSTGGNDSTGSNDSTGGNDSTGSNDSAAAGPLTGDWTVDNSIGTFSYENATSSFAGFRVREELVRIGRVTAVGRTDDVSGSLRIDETRVTAATVTIEMSAITTNDSRRDNAVHHALNVDTHPQATFKLTSHVELGAAAITATPDETTTDATTNPVTTDETTTDATTATNLAFSGVASGVLTVNGVEQPTDFDIEAQLVDDLIVVVGTTDVVFSDFDVSVPSAGIVAQADDFGVIEFQLFFRRA